MNIKTENKVIKVEVSGEPNIGKSTIIEYLTECLLKVGFRVRVDENELETFDDNKPALEYRLKHLGYLSDLVIEIEEKCDYHNDIGGDVSV